VTDLANLGLDRFGQDAARFRSLADQLDRIAEAGGIRSETRDGQVQAATDAVAALPSPVMAAPRIDDLARRFGDYSDHMQVGEVIEVYRAVQALAAHTRAVASVLDRCELFERNWLDQFGHDLGRDWNKAWHAVLENERSDEVNREHERLAAEAQARSAERASALEGWRRMAAALRDPPLHPDPARRRRPRGLVERAHRGGAGGAPGPPTGPGGALPCRAPRPG
jgi:hypothetical protein